MKTYIFSLAFFILFVSAEESGSDTSVELQSIMQAIEAVDGFPSPLEPVLAANLVPSIDEGEETLKLKCLKNGNNDSYDNVQAAKENLTVCIRGLANVEDIQKEIEEAKPKGDLDTVFKKYCKKSPDLRKCISDFLNAMEPCLDPAEKDSKTSVLNITNSLLNFVCYKGGDRIALFIAEGGPECLKSKMEVIQHCLNSSITKYMPEGESTNLESVQWTLEEDKCMEMNNIQACMVRELEHCSEPTPANIVDSLFNFVRKSTPCAKFSNTNSLGQTGGALTVLSSSPALLLALYAVIVAR